MGNDIVAGVSNGISEAFPDCEIYQNDVTQGLLEPCFFIAILQSSRTPYPNGRREHTYPLDVSYFPKEGGDNETMADVSERLMDILDVITLPDGRMVRGTNLSAQVVDNVLHCDVTYTLFTREVSDDPLMEEAEIHANITS